jgi:hypothetical protein
MSEPVFIYCAHDGRRVPIAHVQRNPITGRWSGAFGPNRGRRAALGEFSTYLQDGEWTHVFACQPCTIVAEARDATLDRVLGGVSEIGLSDLAAKLGAAT